MSVATETGLRILVVEDDAAIAELVRYNLEAEGLRPTIAPTGEEAELQVAEDRFDLIVLDWMLPGLSGIELCRRLRRRDAFIDGRTVDVHVGRLRKALIRGSDSDPIRTVRGAGYAFEAHATARA